MSASPSSSNSESDYFKSEEEEEVAEEDRPFGPPFWILPPAPITLALQAVVQLLKEFWFFYHPCNLVKSEWRDGRETRLEHELDPEPDEELGGLPHRQRVERFEGNDITEHIYTPNLRENILTVDPGLKNAKFACASRGQPAIVCFAKQLRRKRNRVGLHYQCRMKKDVRACFLRNILQRAGGAYKLIEAVERSWEHLLIPYTQQPTDDFLFRNLIYLSQPTIAWKLRLPDLEEVVGEFVSAVSDPPLVGGDIRLKKDWHKFETTHARCGHWTHWSSLRSIYKLVKKTFKDCPRLSKVPKLVTREVISVSSRLLSETIFATEFVEEYYNHEIRMKIFDTLSPELTYNVHERVTQQALYTAVERHRCGRKRRIGEHLQSLFRSHSLGEIWTPSTPLPHLLPPHHGLPNKSPPICESPANPSDSNKHLAAAGPSRPKRSKRAMKKRVIP